MQHVKEAVFSLKTGTYARYIPGKSPGIFPGLIGGRPDIAKFTPRRGRFSRSYSRSSIEKTFPKKFVSADAARVAAAAIDASPAPIRSTPAHDRWHSVAPECRDQRRRPSAAALSPDRATGDPIEAQHPAAIGCADNSRMCIAADADAIRATRRGPSHIDKLRIGGARRRLQQRVVEERFHRIDVEVCRHHVVIASQDDGHVIIKQTGGVVQQPIEPIELVIDFGPGSGLPFGR